MSEVGLAAGALERVDDVTEVSFRRVLVTGGAGYVGSLLVPHLLRAGHEVVVLDLYIYGEGALSEVRGHPGLREVKGDIRSPADVNRALEGCDAVIHLACISNDPSFELNPELGRSINFDAFRPLVRVAKNKGIKRFIYASSSSVYGVRSEERVTEDLPLDPLTDYSKFKALCERVLDEERTHGFVTTTLRPATVCGYAPRQRLDLTVNILTNHAVNRGKITVFGGKQKRPNIHISDMVELYRLFLRYPNEKIDGKVFNAGYENHALMEIAEIVRNQVSDALPIEVAPTNDLRSYHVDSKRMREELGFIPKYSVARASADLVDAFRASKLPRSMDDSIYFNVRRMQELGLT